MDFGCKTAAARLLFPLLIGALAASFMGANSVSATPLIQTEFGIQYKFPIINMNEQTGTSCASCHGTNTGVRPASSGVGTAYGKALDEALNGSQIFPTPLEPVETNEGDIKQGLISIENDYPPRVSTVDGSNFNGGDVTLPGTQDTLNVTFYRGLEFDNTTSAIASLNAESTPTALANSIVPATSVNINLSTLDYEFRGKARRDSTPFAVDFEPRNSAGFIGTTPSNTAPNAIKIQFQNMAPKGNADPQAFPRAENTAANPLVLSVLSNDMDPDGPDGPDDPAAQERGLTARLVSGLTGANPGTLTLNPSRTGFLYELPEDDLPAPPLSTTFTYAPVDGEGLQGTSVTVTINLPIAVDPVDPPVANDDDFTFPEDTLFAGDVTLDNGNGVDFDTNGLDTVTFAVLTPPSRGTLNFATDGKFTYMPALNDNGVQTFQYEANDGTSRDAAVVTLTITPVNDAPTVSSVALSPRSVSEAALTVNLVGPEFANDIDGDPLTASDIAVSIVLNEDSTPVSFVEADLYAISGSTITFSPTALAALDEDESAVITVSYTVSDGVAPPVANTMIQEIIGFDAGLGRLPGLYADQISSRYNGHFGGLNEANGSCHTCHLPGSVDADVDSVDECVQSPPVFNSYGLNLCLNRDATTPALADLERRMAQAEPEFAPRLMSTQRLIIGEGRVPGDAVGAPLPVASTGKTVDGNASEILEYLIVSRGALSATDESGQFTVDSSGQMRVAPGATLAIGVYSFFVIPVNDAGQRDSAGNLRPGVPGFFPFEPELQTAFTVEVSGVLPQTVADATATLSGTPVTIAVTANDLGGSATSLSLASAPTNGSAALNADLSITYTPDTGFSGTDIFIYTSSNAVGTSGAATVTVTVLSDGNIAARDDTATTLSGVPITIDVLSNDLGAVTAGSRQTRVTIVSAPDPAVVGGLSVSGQSLVFTPVAGFSGETTARYSAVNPGGTATEAVVTINVLATGTTTISDALSDPELKKVAQAFEQSCALGTDPDFLTSCVNLTAAAIQGENLDEAMRALRNEEHLAAVDTTFTIARGLGRGLQDRIDTVRNGGVRGFDISGLNLTVGGESIPMRLVTDVFNGAMGLTTGDGFDNPIWGVFLSGDISVSEKDATDTAEGFEISTGNMLVGLDYNLGTRSNLGFALGYSSADTDFSGSGSLGTEAIQASVYGRLDDAIGRGIDLDGYFSVGQVDYNSDRRILFTSNGITVDGNARATFDGLYVNFVPTLSFSEQLGRYGDALGEVRTGTELRWRAGLDYLMLNVDGYTETGGEGLALTTQSETYESLMLFVGLDARRPIWLSSRVSSEIRGGLTLRSEFLDDGRSVTSSFAAAGLGAPTFSVVEDGSQGFGGTLDLGATVSFDPGEVALDYSYDFSSDGLRTHSLAIGYSLSFGRLGNLTTGVRGNLASGQDTAAEAEVRYLMEF